MLEEEIQGYPDAHLGKISIAIDVKFCKHALSPQNSILPGKVVLSRLIIIMNDYISILVATW